MRLRFIAVLLAFASFVTFAAAQGTVTTYAVTLDYLGSKLFWRLTLHDSDGKLTGDLDGDILNGTRSSDHITFHAYSKHGGTEDLDGTFVGGRLTGTILWLRDGAPSASATRHGFTADPLPTRAADAKPAYLEFTPTTFYRQFSSDIPPVLHLWPGDTLHTTTVDAGGFDSAGIRHSQGGNPQTGPFFIETAMPGDTLVVRIKRLNLNRDYAMSDDALVQRASSPGLAVKMKDGGNDVRWHLDFAKGVATSELPGAHLKSYSVPLKPMLGCIATAPSPGPAIPTGDSGDWGGNMDFNEVIEGNTVYLPVAVPGALLFVGDGHAAMGDGELNGNALETSMEVELSVDLVRGHRPPAPRVESPGEIMAMGLEGSLDDAIKSATANMADWLQSSYHLTPSEVAQVLGASAEFRISEIADRNAGVVLKLRKDSLGNIQSVPADSSAKQ
jgi:amidase